jgi:hypothetical protein
MAWDFEFSRGLRVQHSIRFRDSDFGFRVSDIGSRVSDHGNRVSGVESRIFDLVEGVDALQRGPAECETECEREREGQSVCV